MHESRPGDRVAALVFVPLFFGARLRAPSKSAERCLRPGAGSQNCQQQGIAGRDVNQSCVNSQVGTTRTGTSGVRTGTTGVRSTGVTGTSGVGNGVQSVSLARTGFDAWVLALLGGISVAGGIGLLAAQRRGRLTA